MKSSPQSSRLRARGLPIETARLRLRPFVPGDAAKVFRMSREESLRTWLPSQVYRDEAHAASVLAYLIAQYDVADPRAGPWVLAVQGRASEEPIGHVGFSPLGDAVEVGFAIEAAHQREGKATEAVRAACAWAVNAFSLPTIVAVAAAGNVASRRVLLRAGFAWQAEEVVRFQQQLQPVVRFAFEAKR